MIDQDEPKAKKPAKPKPKSVRIDGARIETMRANGMTKPTLVFEGDMPGPGDGLEFTLDNGVTYTGAVSEAIEADGQVVVSFADGISPR